MDPTMADGETPVRADDSQGLPRDDPARSPGTIAQAAVDPTLEGRTLQDALCRGYCSWDVNHASWLVWLMARDMASGPLAG